MRNAGCESSFLSLGFDLGILPSFSPDGSSVVAAHFHTDPAVHQNLCCCHLPPQLFWEEPSIAYQRTRPQTLHVWVGRSSWAANGHQTWPFFLLNVIIVRAMLRIPSNAEPPGNPESVKPKPRSDSSHLLTHRPSEWSGSALESMKTFLPVHCLRCFPELLITLIRKHSSLHSLLLPPGHSERSRPEIKRPADHFKGVKSEP